MDEVRDEEPTPGGDKPPADQQDPAVRDGGPGDTSDDSPATAGRRRRSGRWWAGAGAIVVVVLFGVWLAITLALTGSSAKKASASLETAKAALAAGDTAATESALQDSSEQVAAMQSRITSPPLSWLRVVPYLRTNLDAAEQFTEGAQQLITVAESTSGLFGELTGASGGPGVFSNGTIHYDLLEEIQPQIDAMMPQVEAARQTIAGMPESMSPFLRTYQQEALTQIEGIQKGLTIYDQVAPDLPVLLGDTSPQRYLVVFHNPAELYPGGGASLSAALIQFDKGKMKVVDRGAISSHFFPENPRVAWNPSAGEPYYPERGASDAFAWSNLHPDYRIAGEDMMRSWVANGGPPVDGVISLDPMAIKAVLEATGPVESPGYGKITADNLVEKLLYDAYSKYSADPTARHKLNDELVDEVLARLQSAEGALAVARAVFATAPEQHIRIHLSEDRLAKVLHQAEVDGAQPPDEPDRIAFYTQNQNGSKVDIFQTRALDHKVALQADGSAEVTQVATVTNNAPDNGISLNLRDNYQTRWAFHWNVVPLPRAAQDVTIEANPGEVRRDDRKFTDTDGRRVVRIGRWIPPGESSVISVTYRLPAGTFGRDGTLKYRASVEKQLVLDPVQLTVTVDGPSEPRPVIGDWQVSGNTATLQMAVTRPTTIGLDYGG